VEDKTPVTGTDQDKQTIELVTKLLDKSKRASAKQRANMRENYEFVVERKQWPNKRPQYRHSEVLNFTFSVIQSIIPVMTDNRPMVSVLPTEPEDRDFADMLDGVISYVWDKLILDMQIVEAIFDALVYGTSISYVGWDKESNHGLGEMDMCVVDPMYCYPDTHASDINSKDSKYFIYTEPTDVGELKRLYPDKAKDLAPVEIKKPDTNRVNFTDYNHDNPRIESGVEDKEYEGDTLLIRCWLKDNTVEEEVRLAEDGTEENVTKKKYPNGRYIEVCNGVLLRDGPNEYKDGLFPFARLVDHALPREFWGIGEVENLKSPQMILNKVISWILDALNLSSNPIWVIDTNSQVDPDNLTNQQGLVIEKSPGSEVRRESGIEVPQSMYNTYQMVKTSFDMINGLGELTQGQKPAGVTSGIAIESLQEAAQNRIRQKTRNLEMYLKSLGELIVSRIMQFYNTNRIVRIVNNVTGYPDFFEFYIGEGQAHWREITVDPSTGQKIFKDDGIQRVVKGTPDIQMAVGSSLPFARAQKTQMALQLYDRKIIDPEEVLKTIQWPGFERLVEKMKMQAEQMAQNGGENADGSNVPSGSGTAG
jgi:hypothetical protein